MKSVLIFYFVLILTISVATDVKVYVYNAHDFYNKMKRTKPEPRNSFTFGYHKSDVLSMHIYLSFNKNVYMSTDLYIYYPPDDVDCLSKHSPRISSPGKLYYQNRRILNESEIVIELQPNTTAGVFTRNQIVRAVDVTGLPNGTNEFPYNDICLKDQWCVIEVDLVHNAKTGAETTSYCIVAIASALSGIALFLLPISAILAVLAIKKHWMIKDSPRGTPREKKMRVNNPFYVNLLFLKECAKEIEDIEKHIYEEINP